jgi:hypothetical protein
LRKRHKQKKDGLKEKAEIEATQESNQDLYSTVADALVARLLFCGNKSFIFI